MNNRKIRINRREAGSFLDSHLSLRLMNIREMLDRGVMPETYLAGPGPYTLRDIWDEVFKKAGREALACAGHERLPAYTDDTVELLIRDGGGRVEGSRPFMYTDVRLGNGLYRIYRDSIEFGDGAVRLLEPAGLDSVVTGLEEDELAGFLLAFDAIIPMIRKRLGEWSREVVEAATQALASKKADRVAQVTCEELLEKHLRPMGLDWTCSVSNGMVDLVIYGQSDDVFLEIPIREFPAFLRDREAISSVIGGIGVRA